MQQWSKVEPLTYPGGTYKYSNVQNFPGAAGISAALITLFPGGLRELHWHNATEWAIVLHGTCRATVMESGKNRPAETWDFSFGDVWYFRPNEGHTIQGLRDGCTYLAGYDDGTFEDRRSLSLSAWLSTVPPGVTAQGLGVTEGDVTRHISRNEVTFLPLGPVPNTSLEEFRARVGRPPQQPVLQTHRFEIAQVIPEVETPGGYVKVAQVTNFPVSEKMSGALVRFAPGALRQLHWHPGHAEWQYVINGTVMGQVLIEPGVCEEYIMGQGDAGYAPKGSAHWLKNASNNTEAFMVLMFDDGLFTNIDLTWFIGDVDPETAATSLNTSVEFAEAVDYAVPTMVPAKHDSAGLDPDSTSAGHEKKSIRESSSALFSH
ncbi:probable oxalate decarboxylase OxdD [Coccomyxa sp. Obi]|nr:probable oxalate decarboxylase OxdD [Coccomyxa sp. Obi]